MAATRIIAQGLEGGGHRGMFLSGDVAMQTWHEALVPQVADAVDLPVIAAGELPMRGVSSPLFRSVRRRYR